MGDFYDVYSGVEGVTSSNLGVLSHYGQGELQILQGKVDGYDFHLRSSHTAKVLGVVDDGDKAYFDNTRTSHFVENIFGEDELVGTVLRPGTRFTNP